MRGKDSCDNQHDRALVLEALDEMTPASEACVFCERIALGEAFARNDLAMALPDAYPLAIGHTLIVPTRHEADFFALRPLEQEAVFSLLAVVKEQLQRQHEPDGFNVGINVGKAAGQTVSHAHLHLIPRYDGDVADPRGGVRWVLPAKAAYWNP